MDNILPFQQRQAFQQGHGKLADEPGAKALVVVPPYQLVQVERHQLEHDAQVVPEVEGGVHPDHGVIMVPLPQML